MAELVPVKWEKDASSMISGESMVNGFDISDEHFHGCGSGIRVLLEVEDDTIFPIF